MGRSMPEVDVFRELVATQDLLGGSTGNLMRATAPEQHQKSEGGISSLPSPPLEHPTSEPGSDLHSCKREVSERDTAGPSRPLVGVPNFPDEHPTLAARDSSVMAHQHSAAEFASSSRAALKPGGVEESVAFKELSIATELARADAPTDNAQPRAAERAVRPKQLMAAEADLLAAEANAHGESQDAPVAYRAHVGSDEAGSSAIPMDTSASSESFQRDSREMSPEPNGLSLAEHEENHRLHSLRMRMKKCKPRRPRLTAHVRPTPNVSGDDPELERFFSHAERPHVADPHRFSERFNFDVRNGIPVKGRYEWFGVP